MLFRRFWSVANDFVRPIRKKDLSNHWRSIASQNGADSFVQSCKRDFVILFAGQNKQRRLIFLTASFSSFLGKLGDENHRSHVRGVAVRINRHRRRQKRAKRITALVSGAGAWRPDMRWNSLCRHFDPIASCEIVSIPRKLQLPKCGVDAHDQIIPPTGCSVQVGGI